MAKSSEEMQLSLRDRLHVLMDVASKQKDSAVRQAMYDRIAYYTLNGFPRAEEGAPAAEIDAKLLAADEAFRNVDVEREMKPKVLGGRSPDPQTIEAALPCMALADAFHVTNAAKRRMLLEIAKDARKEMPRGIPAFHDPNSFAIKVVGGVPPAIHVYVIGEETFERVPPMESDVKNQHMYACWNNFERVLLDIKDVEEPEAKTIEREQMIRQEKGVKRKHLLWFEAKPKDAGSGIPAISAETARKILRANAEVVERLGQSLENAPATWLTSHATWNPEFTAFARAVTDGELKLSRIERYALGRLILKKLGQIEREIHDIAFPERYLKQKIVKESA